MRLSDNDLKSIKSVFKEVFKKGEIYLFGSRVDDNLKGGDIDLYIICEDKKDILEKKIDFLVKLKQKIGDQKIDVIISKNKNRLIEKEALENGVKL